MFRNKKTAILLCLFSMMFIFANAQVFKGQIIGGVNLSQVDGDNQIGYRKVGAHAGVGAMFHFNFKKGAETKPWSLSMEILLNQKGARKRNYYYKDSLPDTPDGKFEYLLKLNYVSVPVLLHYTDKEKWSFGLGFAYNRMFSVTELEYDVQQTYDTVNRLSPTDISVMGDVRFRIWQQLKFGFRFEYSMLSLRTRSFQKNIYQPSAETRQQRNNSLTFYLVYMLNEKKVDKEKKKERIEKPYYY